MTAIWGLAASLGGFALLCLSMRPHESRVLGQSATAGRRNGARVGGALLLALALFIAVCSEGLGIGLTAWYAWLAAGATAVVLLLTYRPTAIRGTALLAGVIAVAGWLIAGA